MELKILEESKNKIVLQIEGAGHGFCNAIVKELWNDDAMKVAAYNIDHPLVGIPTLIVEVTQGNDPKKAILAAIKRLDKQIDQFSKVFTDNVKR